MMNSTNTIPVWFDTLNTAYTSVLLVFGFILPCTVMIFCYSRVIYHVVVNTEAKTTTNTALLQLRLFILITITFIVTWTPIFVILILTQLVRNGNS